MRQFMHAAVGLGYLAATTGASPTSNANLKCRSCSKTITRDVAIIGGGASGAHAAVWLRDNGQSVVVVEKADQLVRPLPDPLSWLFRPPPHILPLIPGTLSFILADHSLTHTLPGRPYQLLP